MHSNAQRTRTEPATCSTTVRMMFRCFPATRKRITAGASNECGESGRGSPRARDHRRSPIRRLVQGIEQQGTRLRPSIHVGRWMKSTRPLPECARGRRRADARRSARDGQSDCAVSATDRTPDAPRCASASSGEETRGAAPAAPQRPLVVRPVARQVKPAVAGEQRHPEPNIGSATTRDGVAAWQPRASYVRASAEPSSVPRSSPASALSYQASP